MPAMKIYDTVAGNIRSREWARRLEGCTIEYIDLDQWTAQKSRFAIRGHMGGEYAVSLARGMHLSDGDIICWDQTARRAAVVRIHLSEVMAIDASELAGAEPQTILRTAFEAGHAVGNQHWAAVIKGWTIFVPLTVDRKVMDSVMRTHAIEHLTWRFIPGSQVIPYLAPHEIRRLFGSSGEPVHEHGGHGHNHHSHMHEHAAAR